jgi:hypothetical protein
MNSPLIHIQLAAANHAERTAAARRRRKPRS